MEVFPSNRLSEFMYEWLDGRMSYFFMNNISFVDRLMKFGGVILALISQKKINAKLMQGKSLLLPS